MTLVLEENLAWYELMSCRGRASKCVQKAIEV